MRKLDDIERLKALREAGDISEEEFAQLKAERIEAPVRAQQKAPAMFIRAIFDGITTGLGRFMTGVLLAVLVAAGAAAALSLQTSVPFMMAFSVVCIAALGIALAVSFFSDGGL